MNRCGIHRRVLSLSVLLIGLYLWGYTSSIKADEPTRGGHINVYPVEGVINPVIVEFMSVSLEQSIDEGAAAVVFQLDTPGGLVSSTRLIVKSLLNADIPAVVYVSPSGAQAASAGTFITMAGHIAAMAPGTNIGAAHPVGGGGENIEGDMRKKVENDLAAFARSIADKRDRNADWAEEAVRESVSITETEALEQKVVDIVAEDVPDLLAQIDGRSVSVDGDEVTLRTAQAEVRYLQMTWRQQVLAVITHPQIALILLSVASLGLLIELYNPGLILPGVIGAISGLLAFYSLETLPVNYAGLALIGLSFILFILESQIPSFGMLTIGGLVSMFLGALMLIDSPEDYLRIPLTTIFVVVGTTGGLMALVVGAAARSFNRQPVTGQEGMVGATGVVKKRIDPTGMVALRGTLWTAQSEAPIEVDATVRVEAVNGLTLTVAQISPGTEIAERRS